MADTIRGFPSEKNANELAQAAHELLRGEREVEAQRGISFRVGLGGNIRTDNLRFSGGLRTNGTFGARPAHSKPVDEGEAVATLAREIKEAYSGRLSAGRNGRGDLVDPSAEQRREMASSYALGVYNRLKKNGRDDVADAFAVAMNSGGIAGGIDLKKYAEEVKQAREERTKQNDLDKARRATMRGLDPDATVTIDDKGVMTSVGLGDDANATATQATVQDQVTALLTAKTVKVNGVDASNNQSRAIALVGLLSQGGDANQARSLIQSLEGKDDLIRNTSNLLRSLTPEQIKAAVPEGPKAAEIEEALIQTRDQLRQAVRENRGKSVGGDGAGGIFQLIATFFITALVQDEDTRKKILKSMFPNSEHEAAADAPSATAPIIATITPGTDGAKDMVTVVGLKDEDQLAAQNLIVAINDGTISADDKTAIEQAFERNPQLATMRVQSGSKTSSLSEFVNEVVPENDTNKTAVVNLINKKAAAAPSAAAPSAAAPSAVAPAAPARDPDVTDATRERFSNVSDAPMTIQGQALEAARVAVDTNGFDIDGTKGSYTTGETIDPAIEEAAIRAAETALGLTVDGKYDARLLAMLQDKEVKKALLKSDGSAPAAPAAAKEAEAPLDSKKVEKLDKFANAFYEDKNLKPAAALDRLFARYGASIGFDRILDHKELINLATDVAESSSITDDAAFRALLKANGITDTSKIGLEWNEANNKFDVAAGATPVLDSAIQIKRDVSVRQ